MRRLNIHRQNTVRHLKMDELSLKTEQLDFILKSVLHYLEEESYGNAAIGLSIALNIMEDIKEEIRKKRDMA